MKSVIPACGLLVTMLLAGCDRPSAPSPLQYSTAPATATVPTYRLAIHPLHNPSMLSEAYQPLIERLNRELPNVRIELEASRDYKAYEQKFRTRGPALLLPNPWQTMEAIKVGYHVIAMAGDAEDFRGIFIVRRDSTIKRVPDLKGKTISYPSPTALAASIMPQYFLYRQGININTDVTNVYVGSQESAILNTYLGKSAASATWPPPWRLFQRDHPKEAAELKVIWETPPLINNSVMVRDDVPQAVTQKVRQVLLELTQTDEGKAILAGMATAAFHPATDTHYQIVRDYIAAFEAQVRPVEKQ